MSLIDEIYRRLNEEFVEYNSSLKYYSVPRKSIGSLTNLSDDQLLELRNNYLLNRKTTTRDLYSVIDEKSEEIATTAVESNKVDAVHEVIRLFKELTKDEQKVVFAEIQSLELC
jgi:F0F1-type ATP synthase delta subunit